MKTIDELTVAVEGAEAAADQVAEIGYLQARLAGVKSRYASFGVALPKNIATIDSDLADALAEAKAAVALDATPADVIKGG